MPDESTCPGAYPNQTSSVAPHTHQVVVTQAIGYSVLFALSRIVGLKNDETLATGARPDVALLIGV